MAKRKSIRTIQEQAARIERALIERGYGGASARFSRVENASNRYSQNIGRAIGGAMARRGYWYDDKDVDQNRKVSRRTYMGLSVG